MISVIITAFKEPHTVTRAIAAIAKQNIGKKEILVVAPDIETLDAAKKVKRKFKELKIIQDSGKGKPAALNFAVSKAKGEILVLTDGDVWIDAQALPALVKPFEDKGIGAITGNPVSINPPNTKYGYWAHVLTKIADELRVRAILAKKEIICSGYLYAIRKELYCNLPDELLSEDGYISNHIYSSGYRIAYARSAKVYVKYPDNFKDWIKQKKRSAGGYNQNKKLQGRTLRTFGWESKGGPLMLSYVKNMKQAWWMMVLFLSRIYLWAGIYKDVNINKKSREELWLRVESTK